MGQPLVGDSTEQVCVPQEAYQSLRFLPAALLAGQGDRPFVAIVRSRDELSRWLGEPLKGLQWIVDSKGTVAQCDCWVTSYPDSFFGNMFREPNLTRMLRESPARREFVERPKHLVEHEDCLSCRYLSICHGGCPVRTYSALGTMLAKDPYCEVYKAVFGRAETHARKILRSRLEHRV